MISSPSTVASSTLTGLRDIISRAVGSGGSTPYSSLSTDDQSNVDTAIELGGFDRVNTELKPKWSDGDDEITTRGPYSTGTLTIAQRDTAMTGGSTAWNTNDAVSIKNLIAGDRLVVGSGYAPVLSVTTDTAAVLAMPYPGEAQTAAAYSIYRTDYTLADDILQLLSVVEVTTGSPLRIVSYAEFRRQTAEQHSAGQPIIGCLIGADAAAAGASGQNQKLRVWPAPDGVYGYRYHYRRVPTWPSSTLPSGMSFTNLLVAGTMSWLYLHRVFDAEAHREWETYYQTLKVSASRVHQERAATDAPVMGSWFRHPRRPTVRMPDEITNT